MGMWSNNACWVMSLGFTNRTTHQFGTGPLASAAPMEMSWLCWRRLR